MYISHRVDWNKPHENRVRIPTLVLYIDELGVEYSIDLEDLAEALKPFMENKNES